ncbi:MAG: DUF423 domain-containing protein [Proteobacteria bacterium]|nr:DUF423 domain-containing protein [Pseudomonadota bacterium]MBW3617781.1 DUF423 domain-containing protein [Pseudomonadota bacterium]
MRPQLFLAGLSGLIGVAVGAFAAHGVADPQVKDWLRTGGQYQILHAAAVLACCALPSSRAGPRARMAGWLFLAGASVFSGSLYLMAATGVRVLGAITPIGGVLLLAGWATLAWAGLGTDGETRA